MYTYACYTIQQIHAVLKPPIQSQDLEAGVQARSFDPIPNSVTAAIIPYTILLMLYSILITL